MVGTTRRRHAGGSEARPRADEVEMTPMGRGRSGGSGRRLPTGRDGGRISSGGKAGAFRRRGQLKTQGNSGGQPVDRRYRATGASSGGGGSSEGAVRGRGFSETRLRRVSGAAPEMQLRTGASGVHGRPNHLGLEAPAPPLVAWPSMLAPARSGGPLPSPFPPLPLLPASASRCIEQCSTPQHPLTAPPPPHSIQPACILLH
ncbi:collagen alpha-3(VI) chain-like [Triticum dicoccoides]|uniref:collagen alpha-3(VI) chain-like n=1 Tax=Triticum dicoccoides TaxID=85692 RepID=UPI001891EB98|nr:collagen alpha-3(VI) chain-like [Triticum dicoccoides]